VSITGNELHEVRAFYAAEAGLEAAAALLQTEYDSTGRPPLVMPSGDQDVNNCEVTFSTLDMGAAQQRVLTTGTLAGLNALVKSFGISSTAVNAADNVKIQVSQTFEAALVPIFQFAVFYGNDLEIAPGPDMSLVGRVHSNGNLWLQAGSNLYMDSYVTASGNILHGRKGPGSVDNGDVLIKDAGGDYQSMQEGGGWLDADDSYWYDSSVTRWQGRVQDSSHGQSELNLPLSTSANGDPHHLIERETGNPDSYESKATLKIIDQVAYKKVGGVWVDVTADMQSKGIITFTNNKFYDAREGAWVDATELNVQKLYEKGYGPSNGVLYISDQTKDFPAVRIRSASQLGAGLTIASENPMYTLGNFNSTSKKPAALMGDAITFLSGSFSDAASNGAVGSRVASNTTVNASYLTGNVETTSSDYNGGFENLPRFLESWSGKTFTWRGSAVNLWNSVQANGEWSYGSYYTAPNRNWAYDTDLDDPNKLPPETPTIRIFQRTGWRQAYVGYEAEDADHLQAY
jgi:hypothetical protein